MSLYVTIITIASNYTNITSLHYKQNTIETISNQPIATNCIIAFLSPHKQEKYLTANLTEEKEKTSLKLTKLHKKIIITSMN